MKLQVATLSVGENPFNYRGEKDAWVRALVARLEKQGYSIKSDITIEAKMTKLEPDYILQGRMVFELDQTCSRCAEAFRLPVDHSFNVAFAHVHSVEKAAHSEEGEELDLNFFEGPELNLEPTIEEQFVLSLPYKPLCSKSCKGICQRCGKNLNQGSCECKGTGELSPFSILKSLKVD